MFGIGPMELMAILVVALLVFGPKRIPELARTVGRGLAEFRRASSDLRQSLALDELQQDLRKELDPNRTIHRPEDRPAQAGDDDPPPKKSSDDPNESVAEETKADSSAASDRHPGELPTGDAHDYAHRDSDEVGEVGEVGDHDSETGGTDQIASATSAGDDAPTAPTTSTTPTAPATRVTEATIPMPEGGDPETPPRHENHPADSDLGNVPVSGTKPADSRRG